MSVPIAEDITVINKTSQNLHAELLLRLLGKLYGTDGSFEQGTRVVRQFMVDAGVDDGDFFLYDGSGISPDDKIAPRAFTRLLSYASQPAVGRGLARNVARGRRRRHARHRFKDSPLKGRMWAKTGTLDEVNALSGYLTAASGRTLAFSILVNGRRPGSDAEAAGHRPHRRSHRRGGVTLYYGRRCARAIFLWLLLCHIRLRFGWLSHAAAVKAVVGVDAPGGTRRGGLQAKCARCHYPTSTQPLHGPGLQAITKVRAMPSGAPPTDERLTAVILDGRG